MKKRFWKQGFSLLEIIVAIFLIAIVLGTILMLMSANMNVISKANELMITNALEQYTIEDVKNIEFPPVYHDRQASFGNRPIKTDEPEEPYKKPDEVDPKEDGDNWAPSGFEKDFIVRKYDFRYSWDYNLFEDSTIEDTDLTMYHQVDIYILRRNDKYTVSKNSIIISRDGME